MLMLGTVLTRLVQKAGLLISSATTYLTKKLSQLLGVLTDLKIQFVALRSLCVLLVQKVKALLVLCIIQAQLIKAAVTPALAKIWALGLQLPTIVRQIHQRAKQVLKIGK